MKQVPLGLRDYLPHEIDERNNLVDIMKEVVEVNGYSRIITPSIEHFDYIQHALGEDLANHCIKFFDGLGSRLVLRPDHTTPIARIVSSRLSHQLPVKLYYFDPVFRKDPLMGETEIFQFGCEHIGKISIKDEVSVIQMIIEICNKLGIKDAEIHVSHPQFFDSLSNDQLNALKNRDLTSFDQYPQVQIDGEGSEYLTEFFELLRSANVHNVVANKFLYKDLSYYNGLYFDIVSKSFGKVIGSGGRYDKVIDAFELDAHAFGFAFRMHYLEKALKNNG